MSDSYQATYDAIRSKISGGNIGEVVAQVVREIFDISWNITRIEHEFIAAAHELQRPSVLFKPELLNAGHEWWQARYGSVKVFGTSPDEAMRNFDIAWWGHKKVSKTDVETK